MVCRMRPLRAVWNELALKTWLVAVADVATCRLRSRRDGFSAGDWEAAAAAVAATSLSPPSLLPAAACAARQCPEPCPATARRARNILSHSSAEPTATWLIAAEAA